MNKTTLYNIFRSELDRLDVAKVAKRNEKIITGFTKELSPKAIIDGKEYRIFNSNDYLGLRFSEQLRKAEQKASEQFGTGPGSVRFISGTMSIYKNLEAAIARFHGREDAMVFSSAFATNLAVLFCLIKGQSKESLISGNTLVISDSLNHRSIIDGIRVAGLGKEQKAIYEHLNLDELRKVLQENANKYERVLVITDGVFSMLGEYADIRALQEVIAEHDNAFDQGIILIVDDSHGVGACGTTGGGVEEVSGGKADVLIGTLGKAFGADGGYVTGDKILIDYLRESAATYIYSNSISPGVAGAALEAITLLSSEEGTKRLQTLVDNIVYFKQLTKERKIPLAADSAHPIQPILVGDSFKTKQITEYLFKQGVLVTSINYPVVPKGRDEIRVQLSATHTKEDIDYLLMHLKKAI